MLLNGRIKPLDTVARNSLLIIHGQQTLSIEHDTLTATDWLAEILMKSDTADQRRIFVIRNPETLAALGWNTEAGKYFSFRDLFTHLQEVEQQAALAQKVDAQLRSPFQRDIIKLYERLTLYHQLENSLEVAGTVDFKSQVDDLLKNIRPSPIPMNSGISTEALQSIGFLAETGYFFPIPPVPPNDDPLRWRKMGESILQFITAGNMHPAVLAYATLASAFAANDPATFNRALDGYLGWLQQHFPARVRNGDLRADFHSRRRLLARLAGDARALRLCAARGDLRRPFRRADHADVSRGPATGHESLFVRRLHRLGRGLAGNLSRALFP